MGECFPSVHEALVSTPGISKKEEKKKTSQRELENAVRNIPLLIICSYGFECLWHAQILGGEKYNKTKPTNQSKAGKMPAESVKCLPRKLVEPWLGSQAPCRRLGLQLESHCLGGRDQKTPEAH